MRGVEADAARRFRPRTPNMVRLQGEGKFCWSLKNFSRLHQDERIYSPPFCFSGIAFMLLFFPRGNQQREYVSLYVSVADKTKLQPGLKFWMEPTSPGAPCDPRAHQPWAVCDPRAHQPCAVCDPRDHQPWAPCDPRAHQPCAVCDPWLAGWRREVHFSLCVIDQNESLCSVTKSTHGELSNTVLDWGFTELMPLATLHSPNHGYILDDTLQFTIQVTDRPRPLASPLHSPLLLAFRTVPSWFDLT